MLADSKFIRRRSRRLSTATPRYGCHSFGHGEVPSRVLWSWPTWFSRASPTLQTSRAKSWYFATRTWLHTRFLRHSASSRHWMLLPQANWLVIMRNVIVTGGSRGLGLGIVRRLTAEGYCEFDVAWRHIDQMSSNMDETEHTRPETHPMISF